MAINSDTVGLLFRLQADSSDARADIAKFKNELKEIDRTAKDQLSPLQNLAAQSGLTAAQFDSLKSGALGAIGGITAIASVAAGGVAAMFQLAQSASAYGSAIYDATEKTGLSAETLSSMKVAAEQSGSSLEAVTGSLAKFARTIGDAADGSDKAKVKLDNLGVTSGDLDTALAQALKTIAAYPPGVKQMTAAQDAFGRSGADLLPFIKSFDGDLPALIAKCKELGLTMSDEDAAAADEFGDQMDTLNEQLGAVGRTLGIEVMPIFKEFAAETSDWLKNNKGEVKSWAETIVSEIRRAIASVKQFGYELKYISDYLNPDKTAADVQRTATELQRLKNIAGGNAVLGPLREDGETVLFPGTGIGTGYKPNFAPRGPAATSKGKGSGVKPPKESDAQFRKFFTDLGFTVNRTFGKALNDGSLHPAGLAADVSIKGKKIEDIFTLTAAALEKGYRLFDERIKRPGVKQTAPHLHFERSGGKKPSSFLGADFYGGEENLAFLQKLDAERLGKSQSGFGKFQEKRKADAEKFAKEIAEIEVRVTEDTARRQYEIGQATTKYLIDQATIARDSALEGKDFAKAREKEKEISSLQIQLLRDENTELERVADAKKKAAADATDAVEKRKLENEASEAFHKLQLKTIELQREEAKSAEDLKNKLKDLTKTEEEYRLERRKRLSDALQRQIEEREAEDAAEDRHQENLRKMREQEALATDPFYLWKKGWGEFMADIARDVGVADTLFGTFQATAAGIGDALRRAFNNLAQAVGSVVQQYVLYGKTAPGVLKQVLAATLAQLAAEAAVQAVRAAALGFLLLAFQDYAGAANAFISAAMWGTIAVGAALLGRAVAPKQQAESAYSSQVGSGAEQRRSNPGQGRAYSSHGEDPDEVTVGANQAGRGMGEMRLIIENKSDIPFTDFIQMKFVEAYNRGGRMREIIADPR